MSERFRMSGKAITVCGHHGTVVYVPAPDCIVRVRVRCEDCDKTYTVAKDGCWIRVADQ